LGFLRGAAPLYYDILRERPQLGEGPAGEGWLAGDLHVENFGAYRPEPLGSAADRVAFDLNDFDDAFRGPWRLDVIRLATSLILRARSGGLPGADAMALAESLIAAHELAHIPAPPPAVKTLVGRASARSRRALLDARTAIVGGKRRFVRGPRYHSLPAELARE